MSVVGIAYIIGFVLFALPTIYFIWRKLKKNKLTNKQWQHDFEQNQNMRDQENTNINLNSNVTLSTNFTIVRRNSDCYYQKWDDNYNKELGYEWFKICTEYVNFPNYNTLSQRLVNIRKSQGSTQAIIAKCVGISDKTLSSYENGYTSPSVSILEALAKCYKVPLSFLQFGIGDDLISHAKLCRRYGEGQYIESLNVSVRAAFRMFQELLTIDDLELCVKIDTELEFRIGFSEAFEKEKLKKKVTENLISTLSNSDVNQTEFYSSLAENRQVGINVVKELTANGIISKIPKGNSFILHLNKE